MLKKLFFGLFVALFLFPAYAQSPQTFGEKIWWSSAQNRLAAEVSRAVGVPHPGIPYLNPPAGSAPFRNGAIVPQSGDWPSAAMRGNLPGNGPIIDAKAKFKPVDTGAALSRFARKALPIAGTAFAMHDLLEELGFFYNAELNLPEKPNTDICTVAPCYNYQFVYSSYNALTSRTTLGSAVSEFIVKLDAHERNRGSPATWADGGPYSDTLHTFIRTNPGFAPSSEVFSNNRQTTSPLPPQNELSSWEEFADEIASQSGWPTSSSIVPAIKEALESGETIDTDTPTVSGPASQVVNQSTTNNTANNTTTNTTTTNNYTYQGNQVTVNQTTITTITNNTTGETTTETTTTENQQENKPPETPFEMPCGIAGKPPCGVKVDETGVNSDSSTVFDAAKSNIDEVEQAAKDALGDGGPARSIQAPQWSWTFQLPSGCSPYPLEPFGMSVDVCAFQDTIHDLMSLLWVGAGLFGLLGLLRSAFGE